MEGDNGAALELGEVSVDGERGFRGDEACGRTTMRFFLLLSCGMPSLFLMERTEVMPAAFVDGDDRLAALEVTFPLCPHMPAVTTQKKQQAAHAES